jgi:hypothetical protein
VKDDVAARQQRVRRIEQRIGRLKQRIGRLSGQLEEAQRKLDEARKPPIPPELLDFFRKVRRLPTSRTLTPIPSHTLPHWQAALEAERQCEEDLARARALEEPYGIVEREIAEQALEAATAARERMMMDIFEFGGWLHDECKQLSRRGRPPDPEVEHKSKRIAAYILLLELKGLSPKAAVADAAGRYGVKRSTAYAARKKWHPQLRQFGYGSDECIAVPLDPIAEDLDDPFDPMAEDLDDTREDGDAGDATPRGPSE